MRPRAPTARLAGSVPLPLGSALAGRVNEPGILGGRHTVKIGFCMLLWTTHVTDAHRAIIEDIKATGYDGVEIPVFEGSPDHYAQARPHARRDRAGANRDHGHPEPRQEPARRRSGSGRRRSTICAIARTARQRSARRSSPGRCTRRSGIFPARPRPKRSASAPARCTARRGTMRPGRTCGWCWRRSTASSAISPTR